MQDGASVSYESKTDRYVVQKPNGKVQGCCTVALPRTFGITL